jgi:aryl sulfotransferase
MPKELPKVTRTYQNHTLDSTRWQRYQPRSDDIIIVTSPKSGTTWMKEIVGQLIFSGQVPPKGADILRNKAAVWFEPRWAPLGQSLERLETQEHRRFIQSHLPLDGLPFYPQVQYIVVGRDVRDVFMSVWNHHANFTPAFLDMINSIPDRVGDPMPTAPDDIHEFWRDWISRGWFAWEDEGYPWWGNMHHSQSWWDYRHLPNILFVHYNDLLTDLEGEITRIATYLSIPLTQDALAAIVQAVSFGAMRERALDAEGSTPSAFKEGAKTFFFKGTNGRWKDVLSAEELALYEEKAAQVLTPECRAWLEQGRAALV